jgi:adenylate cyclase class IV
MGQVMKHIEFETKYRVDKMTVESFVLHMKAYESDKDYKDTLIFQDIQDDYYVSGGEFIRHRYSERYGSNTLTWKKKLRGGDNIIRKEINAELKDNNKEGIENTKELIKGIGFKLDFTIHKPVVYIFEFESVYIPYYSVVNEDGEISRFIEIEIKEDKIHKFTEEEAWGLIRSWERRLSPLGISYRNRMNKSIFEIYSNDSI